MEHYPTAVIVLPTTWTTVLSITKNVKDTIGIMAKVDPRVTYSRDAKHSSLISLRWSSKKYGFHVCPTPTNVHHHGNRLTNKSLSLSFTNEVSE